LSCAATRRAPFDRSSGTRTNPAQGLESRWTLRFPWPGGERPSVEGLVHHDNARAFDPLAVALEARKLYRRFVRLAAGIAEKRRVGTADPCELLRESLLLRDDIEVGSVD
jgi:hypothetical protein